MIQLEIEKRDISENVHTLRQSGKIPAVFYGRKAASTPITLSEVKFLSALKEAGESSVIVLKGIGEEHEALIHDIDYDPVSGKVRHADFYVVEKGKKLQVSVPIEFEGVSPAVKELAGNLIKVLHELEIEATSANLPHEIIIDISSLVDFDSRITAADIKLPNGVELVTGPEEVIALVQVAQEEVEEEVAPVDISSIELSEKKGKKEEDEESKGGGEGETKSK